MFDINFAVTFTICLHTEFHTPETVSNLLQSDIELHTDFSAKQKLSTFFGNRLLQTVLEPTLKI
jgi:hypothetical protein